MEETFFSRTEQLVGKENVELLRKSKVAIIGIGGVGSFAVEAFARAGVGTLVLADADIICISNLNRQIHALRSTLGASKVYTMKDRVLDINPNATVICIKEFFSANNAKNIFENNIDYVVDAIDDMRSKIELIMHCKRMNIPIISAMGAGNKLDPTGFRVTDISKTSICPMARKIRKELRKNGIKKGVKVVFSKEAPLTKLHPPGSISFVPSVMGLIIAGEVINELLKN